MTDAEPLEGITDAIQAADLFLSFARRQRERPGAPNYREWTIEARDGLIAKLQALK